MALHVKEYKRVFKHNGQKLSDPNPDMTPEEVMNFYSNQYPELKRATSMARKWRMTRPSMSSRQP